MTNREKCLAIIDSFNDDQLANVALMLESAKTLAEETADEAYCLRLYDNYQANPDKGETIPLEDFAQSLGIDLT